jgi:hypothetical protein
MTDRIAGKLSRGLGVPLAGVALLVATACAGGGREGATTSAQPGQRHQGGTACSNLAADTDYVHPALAS